MTNTNCQNCQNCDDPKCNVAKLYAAMLEMDDEDPAFDRAFGLWQLADGSCQADTVNWRARALTAEAALAAVRATANRLADFFDRQPSDYRLGLRHGAQRAVEAAAEAKP